MHGKRVSHLSVLILALVVCSGLIHCEVSGANATDTEPNVAGLVVDYGDGRVSYAIVPFEEPSISGLELLERSGFPLLILDFGGMGAGVCAIEDVGCDIDACRSRMCQTGDPDSPFWQYLSSSDDETWTFSPLGASGSPVENGDVNGWFWTDDEPAGVPPSIDVIAGRLGIASPRSLAMESEPSKLSITVGDAVSPSDRDSIWQTIGGLVVLGGVAGAGGYAVIRSRRHQGQ